ELGCVPTTRHDAVLRKREAIERERERLRTLWATPANARGAALEQSLGITLSRETCALDLLRRPGLGYRDLVALEGFGPGVDDAQVAAQVEVAIKYEGYLERQNEEIERNRR